MNIQQLEACFRNTPIGGIWPFPIIPNDEEVQEAGLDKLKYVWNYMLDQYYESEEALTWFYDFGGTRHKQVLYDKDVADIVTTANSGVTSVLWSFYDGTSAQMNSNDLIAFRNAAKERDEFLWSHWGYLRNQINEANTQEELENIDIYSGWE